MPGWRTTRLTVIGDTPLAIAVQRGEHIGVGAAHAPERARLVLAVLEHALLVRRERMRERRRHRVGERAVGVEREQEHSPVVHTVAPISMCAVMPGATPTSLPRSPR